MKKFLVSTLAALFLVSSTGFGFEFKEKKNLPKTPETVELDVNNTVVLRGEVSEETVGAVIKGIELNNNDEVYLYISSPGGSVFAGMALLSYIRNTPKKVTCVADTVISMAFVLFTACDLRLSTESTVAMQHQAAYGIRPQPSENAKSFHGFLSRSIELMDRGQAERIGISYDDFKKKTLSDWWMYGTDVVTTGVSQRLVKVTCTRKSISAEVDEVIQTMFGQILVTWSACPIIAAPIRVDFKKYYGSLEQSFRFIESLDVKTRATAGFAK